MRVLAKYSHLNGEEFLLVHHHNTYQEILHVIRAIDTHRFKTKVSEEKTMKGKLLYSPDALNKEFTRWLRQAKWEEKRYAYYVTTDRRLVRETIDLPLQKQRALLVQAGVAEPIQSYKQTDFVKDSIAIEVQFGKYAFVAYDLFVKHVLFYSGNLINVGIEVLPMKIMQAQMSSGIAYYEGEVYNVLRHGRGNPPVPLVILGVAP